MIGIGSSDAPTRAFMASLWADASVGISAAKIMAAKRANACMISSLLAIHKSHNRRVNNQTNSPTGCSTSDLNALSNSPPSAPSTMR